MKAAEHKYHTKIAIGVDAPVNALKLKVEERKSTLAETAEVALAKIHNSVNLQNIISNAPKFSKEV